MQLGMIGLGRMGANMAERLRGGGHEVVGYDPFSDATDVATLEALCDRLEPPRTVWVMVPAGAPTDETMVQLTAVLAAGDLVVNGGNTRWTESIGHGAAFAEAGIGFVDAGVSGGVWGLENGYALMVGGTDDDVARIRPALQTLSPDDPDGKGLAHVGPVGSGHFTKMVHNGIEYAVMQAFAEGYELMARTELDIDLPATMRSWQEGSVIRSWLLDLFVRALDAHPGFADLDDVAKDSGEGRWTVEAAIDAGVPVPAIASALFARFESQHDESLTMKAVAALREQFGGHAVVLADGDPTKKTIHRDGEDRA
ncbi:phosphogluconate dehydrogenase (NAD(+)-dependent, decarboxylating) [Actinospongicola halichondriae]|uniref:phosphogluconate dehydrogenase (NAD(+)-dependent, decarboxylating) n=1 Tax=Actinospongicola halichondriae TaxID=3236844 RepID=UPI003D447BD9